MPRPKPPSPVRVGMRADELRKMRGRGPFDLVSPPEWVEYGQSAKWHYADCTVTLERDGDGPYRVTEVVEVEGDGAYDRPDNGD